MTNKNKIPAVPLLVFPTMCTLPRRWFSFLGLQVLGDTVGFVNESTADAGSEK